MQCVAFDPSAEPSVTDAVHDAANGAVSTHPWTAPLKVGEARASLRKAERLRERGQSADALLQLRIVERAMPRIEDRIALERGDVLMDTDLPEQACKAYELAAGSLDRSVAVRGRVGLVRCKLRSGERDGEARLQALLRRYPHLAEREQLRLEQARARDRWGNRWGAAALYRSIDLADPASHAAAEARAELERLKAAGVTVRAFSATERLDRAELLLSGAPLTMVTAEVEALQKMTMNAAERARLHLLAGRLARIQGRWKEVRDEMRRARQTGAPAPEIAKLTPPPQRVDQLDATELRAAERRIAAIVRSRPVRKLNNGQLRLLLSLAVQYEKRELADEVLEAMVRRESLIAAARFDAAIEAAGFGDDRYVAELFEGATRAPQLRVSASYHQARALERLGRSGEAEALYLDVILGDRSATRYYAMWADQRLWALHSAAKQSCLPPEQEPLVAAEVARGSDMAAKSPATMSVRGAKEAGPDAGVAMTPQGGEALSMISSWLDLGSPSPVVRYRPMLTYPTRADLPPGRLRAGDLDGAEVLRAPDAEAPERERARLRRQVRKLLEPIAAAHGEAYPWLGRALDLVMLDRFEDAADEVHEAYLAYRDAIGSPRLRSGLEAVYTGSAPARRPADWALRQAREDLGKATRLELSRVARLLGDAGTALRLGVFSRGERPRAYADEVERAARRHGLDPNLLFAVMRVESIFNRRIVSYAGAVGLMQIMPATGRRIADQLGVEGFEVPDLLDPQTNLNFSAWYLASLLRRFDGRLPLAIASYNGGPHNVRLWMGKHHPDMPLDAFLELIPFSQTHRYVRRVLTHYAAYRAQKNLPMTRLSVDLPELRSDRLAF
ncbi:MAG: lytic transglycosylase domain-containing protein [Myxococcales bacterium]|nr:lytic transglycosylase domain-containing protein [Myxococcales bacterium]